MDLRKALKEYWKSNKNITALLANIDEREVFVTADTHGCFDALIKGYTELMTENSLLIHLGDMIDRGPGSVEALQFLITESSKGHCIVLMGNHEWMFLECMQEYLDYAEKRYLLSELESVYDFIYYVENIDLPSKMHWYRNGGRETLIQMRERIHCLEELEELLRFVSSLPDSLEITYRGKSFCFVHGAPGESTYDKVWGRVDGDAEYFSDKLLVFGHTPTCFYQEDDKTDGRMKVFYGENKIGIDTGAVYPRGNMAFLRLSDLKPFYYR